MSVSVELKNVTISYNRHPALHHINGVFMPGTLTAIAGPNGAGKSTLLKAIAGVLKANEGEITISRTKSDRFAFLPQASAIQKDFPVSVMHILATGFWNRTGNLKKINYEMKAAALSALESVGLKGFDARDISGLSAGQFQRVMFARLILQDASLILLDEPFNSIDAETTALLLEIIMAWHRQGRTIICVLHDFEQIKKYFPDCLLLSNECIAWDKSENVLTPENLLKATFSYKSWSANPEICLAS